jgi:hypothetical protein
VHRCLVLFGCKRLLTNAFIALIMFKCVQTRVSERVRSLEDLPVVVGGKLLADGLGCLVMAAATGQLGIGWWGRFVAAAGALGGGTCRKRGPCWCCAVAALS